MTAGTDPKKNSSFHFILHRKKTKESCDRVREIWTVHRERGGEEPFPLNKSTKSGKISTCEKDFVSKYRVASVSYLCNDRGYRTRYNDEGKCCSSFGKRAKFITRASSMTGDPLEV